MGSKCGGTGSADDDTGTTGLALLAFLGAGYTHLASTGEAVDLRCSGSAIRFKDVVKKGLRWLIANQDPDGCVGPTTSKAMYNHAIATGALVEAYGMTGSQILREPAQQAVDYILAARNPGAAWGDTARCGENDVSVTGWCVMALASAKESELKVDDSAMSEAAAWLDSAPESRPMHAAIAMLTRILAGADRNDPHLEEAANRIVSRLPDGNDELSMDDYVSLYWGTLALFQFDGPDSGGNGKIWKPWNEAIKKVLPKNQHAKADGCAEGSWDPSKRVADPAGRVHATAMNALTMEVYSRYPNAFGVRAAKKPR